MGSAQTADQRFQRSKLISIVDRGFINGKLKDKEFLSIQHVNYKVYDDLGDFQGDIQQRYINSVLVDCQSVVKVVDILKSLQLCPNIYLLSNKNPGLDYGRLKMVSNMRELTNQLQNDMKVIENIDNILEVNSNDMPLVSILRRNSKTQEFSLLQKIFTERKVNFRTFSEFNTMLQELEKNPTYFVVTETLFTLQLSKVLEKKKTKCFSYTPTNDKTFFEMAYYYSSDLTDIANEIDSEIIEKDLPSTPCTRTFIYTVGLDHVHMLQVILIKNQFEVRTLDDIQDLIGVVLSHFAITIFVEESEVKNFQKKLQQINYFSKAKIIVVKNIPFQDVSINKEVKEVKKGYRLTKQLTREVDIVDKDFDNVAYQSMREQFQKGSVIVNIYKSAKQYFNRKKYQSEICITSYGDRQKMSEYISNQHMRVKLVLFCAKTKITQDLMNDGRFSMVDSNHLRIAKHIKTLKCYYPRITNFTNRSNRIEQVVEKFKITNRRVSIQRCINNDTVANQFVVLSSCVSKPEITQMQRQAADLWKLQYQTIKGLQRLKKELVQSLKELRKIYKVKIDEAFFDELDIKLAPMSIWQLVEEINTMFDSGNCLIPQINSSLCRLDQIMPLELLHLKEFMVIMSLNALSYFEVPPIKKAKLVCWVSKFDDQEPIGSIYLNKKYHVFHQESAIGIDQMKGFKLEVQLNMDKFQDKSFEYNNFVQFRDKFICMPYTKFRLDNKKPCASENPYTLIKLAYIKDTEYLQAVCGNNLPRSEGIYKAFSNPKLIDQIKNPVRLVQKQAQINQVTSLLHFHKSNFSQCLTFTLNSLKLYEGQAAGSHCGSTTQLLYQSSFVCFQVGKLEESKKYLMACLRADPLGLLKQKTNTLKNKLKQVLRQNKMDSLENSLLIEPLKSNMRRDSKLNVFADTKTVDLQQQENTPQVSFTRKATMQNN